jgi:hypothetical protein
MRLIAFVLFLGVATGCDFQTSITGVRSRDLPAADDSPLAILVASPFASAVDDFAACAHAASQVPSTMTTSSGLLCVVSVTCDNDCGGAPASTVKTGTQSVSICLDLDHRSNLDAMIAHEWAHATTFCNGAAITDCASCLTEEGNAHRASCNVLYPAPRPSGDGFLYWCEKCGVNLSCFDYAAGDPTKCASQPYDIPGHTDDREFCEALLKIKPYHPSPSASVSPSKTE